MKHTVYLVLGHNQTQIIKNWEVENFLYVKDKIRIYSFQTKEELDAFLKGIEEAIGFKEYEVLNDKQIDFIMNITNNE
jgi:hypothetical protein